MGERPDFGRVPTEMRKIARSWWEQGGDVRFARNGHVRFFTADGTYVVDYPSTASSQTRLRNTLAALKRAGLVWPTR